MFLDTAAQFRCLPFLQAGQYGCFYELGVPFVFVCALSAKVDRSAAGGPVDDKPPASPNLYYTAILPGFLVYKVVQDVHHQLAMGPGFLELKREL